MVSQKIKPGPFSIFRRFFYLFFIGAGVFLFCLTASSALAVEIEEVLGGDIYRLNTGEEVRLAGVNTKVIRSPGKRGKEFTQEALKYIANLFSRADVEVIDSGIPKKKDGRRQVYIYLIDTKKKLDPDSSLTISEKDKTLLNLEIIRRGYGKTAWGYKGEYKDSFKTAQKEAKKKHLGLWRS